MSGSGGLHELLLAAGYRCPHCQARGTGVQRLDDGQVVVQLEHRGDCALRGVVEILLPSRRQSPRPTPGGEQR